MKQSDNIFNEHLKGRPAEDLINNVHCNLHHSLSTSDITVIIPSGGRPTHLECCIKSLKE